MNSVDTYILVNIPQEILFNHITWSLPKCETEDVLPQWRMIDRPEMEQAHALAERIQNLTVLCLTSKELNKICHEEKEKLTNEFLKKLTAIQQRLSGARNFRGCVESGWYLLALRIYYFHKPEALLNTSAAQKLRKDINLPPLDLQYIKKSICKEGSIGTILHNAVYSPHGIACLSSSFVSFILKLNKDKKLGLLEAKDKENKTPSEVAVQTPVKKSLHNDVDKNLEKTQKKRSIIGLVQK